MPDIKMLLGIDAPAYKVFQLISTGNGFSQWWAADVSDHAEDVTLGFFNRTTMYHLHRARSAAPHEIGWVCLSGAEWEGTSIRFLLSEAKGVTMIRFAHANWRSETDYFASCTATWGELLFRLKSAAEGRGHGPLFSATGMSY